MKTLITLPMVLVLLTTMFAGDLIAQRGRGHGQRRGQTNENIQSARQRESQKIGREQNARKTTAAALTEAERQGLVLMREEEKLARDF